MGLQDRDYWKDWSRQQIRKRAGSPKRRAVLPAWILWPTLILIGVVAAKLSLDLHRSERPFPSSGTVHWYVAESDEPTAQLTLIAPAASNVNYVVKIDRWDDRSPVAMIPVRGGDVARVPMPLGVYRMSIIKGFLWRGPDRLFAVRTDAREAVHPLSFHRVGNTFTGHTIRLETLMGNMPMQPVMPGQ